MVTNGRKTITEVAELLGVTTKTIARWEKSGKIGRSKRDCRGWRSYAEEDVLSIKEFHDSLYDL